MCLFSCALPVGEEEIHIEGFWNDNQCHVNKQNSLEYKVKLSTYYTRSLILITYHIKVGCEVPRAEIFGKCFVGCS